MLHTTFKDAKLSEANLPYNPPINFHVILLATLRHVV